MASRGNTPVDLSDPCEHVTDAMPGGVHRPPPGCEECLEMGSGWVHLRSGMPAFSQSSIPPGVAPEVRVPLLEETS